MGEKRMLIVDADVVRRIEENRGDMSLSDFISFLIDSQLKLSYGLELGKQPTDKELDKLSQKLQALSVSAKAKSP